MARARNLKPSFFLNEDLAEVEPLGRILFQGLWCIADRRGRLQDRPKRIKIEVLPYDDADVDALLDVLSERGFLIRYGSGAERYIQIVNFEKHQNPHQKEAESTIPPPEEFDLAPDKHGASTVQEPEEHDTSRALTLNPQPSTLNPVVGGAPDDAPAATAIEMTATERRIVSRLQQVRGMGGVSECDIAAHLRDILSDRASPLPEDVLLAEAMRFRDYWQDKRRSQPEHQQWRSWKRAVTNWFTRTRHDDESPSVNGLDRYEDWTGRYAETQT